MTGLGMGKPANECCRDFCTLQQTAAESVGKSDILTKLMPLFQLNWQKTRKMRKQFR